MSGSNLRARVEAIMRNEIGRPMTRGRRCALAVAIVAAVAGPVAGGALTLQSQIVVPPPAIAFETVFVKPNTRNPPCLGPVLAIEASLMGRLGPAPEDGLIKTGGCLRSLIQAAYNITRFQLEGGPAWVDTERYDIQAQSAGQATPDQIRGVLQSLLADRFKLALRRETRTMPVYELVVADEGLKIAAMQPGECITKKELRWDVIDWDAPLYLCDGARRRILSQSPETRPRPRWPRVTRFEGWGHHDGDARRHPLSRCRPRRCRQDRLHGAVQSLAGVCVPS